MLVDHYSQVSVSRMTAESACTRGACERQQNEPPRFHCDVIRFMSPKQAYSLPANAHLEWSLLSLQTKSSSCTFLTFLTWNGQLHQGWAKGRPQVSATSEFVPKNEVNPSSKMLPLSLPSLKMILMVQPIADLRSMVEKRGPMGGRMPFPSLYRFCVLGVLVTVDSKWLGLVGSSFSAIFSNSVNSRVKQEICWPKYCSLGAIIGSTCPLTKAGYLGMECEMKKPRPFSESKAITPFECADVELVDPPGFSSFQATRVRFIWLIRTMVAPSGPSSPSTSSPQNKNSGLPIRESQQPQPVALIMGGTLSTTHHGTGCPSCPMQLCAPATPNSSTMTISIKLQSKSCHSLLKAVCMPRTHPMQTYGLRVQMDSSRKGRFSARREQKLMLWTMLRMRLMPVSTAERLPVSNSGMTMSESKFLLASRKHSLMMLCTVSSESSSLMRLLLGRILLVQTTSKQKQLRLLTADTFPTFCFSLSPPWKAHRSMSAWSS